ncbi:MAG: tetratricopeptide repeat protein [Myxococcales bacterium]|nr:tetratricopeptide repeat protein [Myxococcales bacterium]
MRLSPALTPAIAVTLAAFAPSVEAHPDIAEKEAFIEQALQESPADPTLHLQRALIQRQRARWDEAAASYLRAAALGADRDQVGVALAQVFLDAGWPKTAEMQVQQVLHRRPENAQALITRAHVRRALGKPQGAAADFERGVGRLVHPEPGLVQQAMNAQLAADRPEVALQIADEAMQKIGIVVSVQLPAIEIELELGRLEAALARIDALLLQAPRHELWLAQRGEILEGAGRVAEARATYEHILSLIQERPPRRRSEKIAALERRLRAKLMQAEVSEE